MCQKNRDHLARFEPDNLVMEIKTEQDALQALRDVAVGWINDSHLFLGVFHRGTGEFVAQVYIGVVSRDLPEFQIGYFADVDHEGQGFVTEAVMAVLGYIFDDLKAQRVSLECDDTNLRSMHVAERCGFVQEGHIRENKRNPDGTISGSLHYGLLKSEYNTQVR